MIQTHQYTVNTLSDLETYIYPDPGRGYVGQAYQIDVSYNGVSNPDVMINWGAGGGLEAVVRAGSYQHVYMNSGTYTITVDTFEQGTGRNDIKTTTVEIAASILTLTNIHTVPSPASGDQPLTVDFYFTPTGGFAPYSYIMKYNRVNEAEGVDTDANLQSAEIHMQHTYNTVGSFIAELTVTDAQGNIAGLNIPFNLTLSQSTLTILGAFGLSAILLYVGMKK